MGRKKRHWDPDYFYHIVCRGNRRDALFLSDGDYRTFLYILQQTSTKAPFELASYCLMTNHFHLQLRSQDQSISKVMSLINKRYANYFNTRHNTTGHVFEERFYDRMIASDYGMLKVSSYIHLNPVEAGMVDSPETYPWSSYPFYVSNASQGNLQLNINTILDIFPGNELEKRRRYKEFLADEDNVNRLVRI
ncbi:REP-associated tyrosine transposase [Virgibacillus natechei]